MQTSKVESELVEAALSYFGDPSVTIHSLLRERDGLVYVDMDNAPDVLRSVSLPELIHVLQEHARTLVDDSLLDSSAKAAAAADAATRSALVSATELAARINIIKRTVYVSAQRVQRDSTTAANLAEAGAVLLAARSALLRAQAMPSLIAVESVGLTQQGANLLAHAASCAEAVAAVPGAPTLRALTAAAATAAEVKNAVSVRFETLMRECGSDVAPEVWTQLLRAGTLALGPERSEAAVGEVFTRWLAGIVIPTDSAALAVVVLRRSASVLNVLHTLAAAAGPAARAALAAAWAARGLEVLPGVAALSADRAAHDPVWAALAADGAGLAPASQRWLQGAAQVL